MSTILKLCDIKSNIESMEKVEKINTETLIINEEDVPKNHLDTNGNLDADFEQTLLDISEEDYLAIEECDLSTEEEDKLLFDDSIEKNEGDGNVAENNEYSLVPSSSTYSISVEICDIQMKSIKEEIIENSEDFSVKPSSSKANKCDILSYDDSTDRSEDKSITKDDECSLMTSSKTCNISGLICDIQIKNIKESMTENSENLNLNCKSTESKNCDNIFTEEKCSEDETKGNECDRLLYDEASTESRENQKNIAAEGEYNLLLSSKTCVSGKTGDMQMKSIKEGMTENSENFSPNCKSTESKKCDSIFTEEKSSEDETNGNECDGLLYDETSTESSENKKNIAKDDEYNLLLSSKNSCVSGETCNMQMQSIIEDIRKDTENFSVKCNNFDDNKFDDTFIEEKYSENEIKTNKCSIFTEEKCSESQKNHTGKNVAQDASSKIVSDDKADINSKKSESINLNNEIKAHTEKRLNDEICFVKNKTLKCNSDSDCKKPKIITEKKIVRSVVIKKEINEPSKETEKYTDLTSASDKLPINLKELHSTNPRNEAVSHTGKKDDEILKYTSDTGCKDSTITNEKKAIRSVVLEKKKESNESSKESQEYTKLNSVHKTTVDSNASEKQNQNVSKNLEFNEDEKKDIEDPEWESVRNLTTTEERYKHVREVWQSATVPNPNKNLTYHSYRKKRIGINKAKKVKQHKRKATNNLEHPERKRSRPCTYIIDKCIDSVMMEKDSKTNDIMAEMKSHIRQWEYRSQPNPYYQSYHSAYIYDLHAAYNQEINEITNRYHMQVDQCDAQYQSKIYELEKKRNEVYQFFNFYKGLDNTEKSDPTLVTEKQLQELEEIENMYKQFDKYYS